LVGEGEYAENDQGDTDESDGFHGAHLRNVRRHVLCGDIVPDERVDE
jgi:hypothetical protein